MKRLILLLSATIMALTAATVDAKGGSFSSGRSSFSTSRSYSRPAAPRAPQRAPVVVKKSVTVQQNVTHVTHVTQSSGGGFMTTFLGSLAGSSVANYLFAPKPQPTPEQRPIDCAVEQNKTLAVCLQHPIK